MSDFAQIIYNDLPELLEQIEEKVNEALKESVQKQVDEILATAQALCPTSADGEGGKYPHPSGNLKASLYGSVSSGGHFGRVGIDVKKAYYGPFVHFGTHKMAARPFLYQASERNESNFSEDIQETVNNKLGELD